MVLEKTKTQPAGFQVLLQNTQTGVEKIVDSAEAKFEVGSVVEFKSAQLAKVSGTTPQNVSSPNSLASGDRRMLVINAAGLGQVTAEQAAFFNGPDGNSLKNFYLRNSDGKLRLTFDFAPLAVHDGIKCATRTNMSWYIQDAVSQYELQTGLSIDAYDFVWVLTPPRTPTCFNYINAASLQGQQLRSVSGLKTVGVAGVSVYGDLNDPNVANSIQYLISHEFGHNLGLNHAGAYICSDNIGPCSVYEYDDLADVMGSSLADFGPGRKHALQWLDKGDAEILEPTDSNYWAPRQILEANFGSGTRTRTPKALIYKLNEGRLVVAGLNPITDHGFITAEYFNTQLLAGATVRRDSGVLIKFATDWVAGLPNGGRSVILKDQFTSPEPGKTLKFVGDTIYIPGTSMRLRLVSIDLNQAVVIAEPFTGTHPALNFQLVPRASGSIGLPNGECYDEVFDIQGVQPNYLLVKLRPANDTRYFKAGGYPTDWPLRFNDVGAIYSGELFLEVQFTPGAQVYNYRQRYSSNRNCNNVPVAVNINADANPDCYDSVYGTISGTNVVGVQTEIMIHSGYYPNFTWYGTTFDFTQSHGNEFPRLYAAKYRNNLLAETYLPPKACGASVPVKPTMAANWNPNCTNLSVSFDRPDNVLYAGAPVEVQGLSEPFLQGSNLATCNSSLNALGQFSCTLNFIRNTADQAFEGAIQVQMLNDQYYYPIPLCSF